MTKLLNQLPSDQPISESLANFTHRQRIGNFILPQTEGPTIEEKMAKWKERKGVLFLDADGFLTVQGDFPSGKSQGTVWQNIKVLLNFPEEVRQAMLADYKRWGKSTDLAEQLEWADETYKHYCRQNVNRRQIRFVAEKTQLRRGVANTLRRVIDQGNQVVIVSYGIKDILEQVLHRNKLLDQIEVFADTLEYDKKGVVVGADPNKPRIVGANKGDFVRKVLENLPNPDRTPVFVEGDSIHDLHMLEAVQNSGGNIGLYFDHSGQTNGDFTYGALGNELYTLADVISVNKISTSFRPVSDFLIKMVG